MGSAPIKVNHIDSRVVHGPSKPSYNRIDSQWTLFLAVPLCETDTPTDTPPPSHTPMPSYTHIHTTLEGNGILQKKTLLRILHIPSCLVVLSLYRSKIFPKKEFTQLFEKF